METSRRVSALESQFGAIGALLFSFGVIAGGLMELSGSATLLPLVLFCVRYGSAILGAGWCISRQPGREVAALGAFSLAGSVLLAKLVGFPFYWLGVMLFSACHISLVGMPSVSRSGVIVTLAIPIGGVALLVGQPIVPEATFAVSSLGLLAIGLASAKEMLGASTSARNSARVGSIGAVGG